MKVTPTFLALLLLIVVTLVVATSRDAVAQGGGGDATRDLIAVTGSYGSGASALYVIDTKTRHLAVYRTNNGQHLELVAARDITYDLRLDEWNDRSEPGYSPRELRKAWLESNRNGGATSRPTGSPSDTGR